jgi:hypothetical protein
MKILALISTPFDLVQLVEKFSTMSIECHSENQFCEIGRKTFKNG